MIDNCEKIRRITLMKKIEKNLQYFGRQLEIRAFIFKGATKYPVLKLNRKKIMVNCARKKYFSD